MMGTVVCHCTERAHASLLNVAHIGTVPVTMTPRCLGASSLPVASRVRCGPGAPPVPVPFIGVWALGPVPRALPPGGSWGGT